jgi:hypothetical protein
LQRIKLRRHVDYNCTRTQALWAISAAGGTQFETASKHRSGLPSEGPEPDLDHLGRRRKLLFGRWQTTLLGPPPPKVRAERAVIISTARAEHHRYAEAPPRFRSTNDVHQAEKVRSGHHFRRCHLLWAK